MGTKIIGGGLQMLNYDYYPNGFLEGVNDNFIPGGLSTTSNAVPTSNSVADLYRMKLQYDGIGNITTWQSQNRSYALETYTYTYDGLNRILNNTSSANNFSQTFTYEDLIGNIGTISRYDLVLDNGMWPQQQIDDLNFTYLNPKSSRLQNIVDATNHEKGYRPNNEDYDYDGNGNLIYDPQQQLTTTYNYLNLCASMTKPTGAKMEYIYDATGTKWQQIAYDASGNAQKRSYIGGMEFLGNTQELVHHATGYIRNKNAGNAETLVLSGAANGSQQAKKITSSETVNITADLDYKAAESITLQAGFIAKIGSDLHLTIAPLPNTPDYEWQYKIVDHLGNTRVLFADKDGDGLIKQADDETNEVLGFYNYSSDVRVNETCDYLYNGKEFNDDFGLGWYDYGARFYDPSIARWNAVDPHAENYYSLSPFHFVGNNPLSNLELDGRDFIVKDEDTQNIVIDALATAFNGNKSAFSFDNNGKLSIDNSSFGDLSTDQQFLLETFSETIVNNNDFTMSVSLTSEGLTRTEPVLNEDNGFIGADVFINLNQADLDEKMRDTEDGSFKLGDPNYQPTDTEKIGTTVYHEIGHNYESIKGNNDPIRNNRNAVGYENIYRGIGGFTPRIGKRHGQKKENGKYVRAYQGTASPTGYKKFKRRKSKK